MNEKLIEKKLREEIKKMGGIALKFTSQYFTGMPDRIILMPKGKIYFVELKTTGEKPSPIQEVRIKMLKKLGFEAYVIDRQEQLNEFLDKVGDAK